MTNKHCSYCGKQEHYAKGLCRACWSRMKRNGTLEYQYHRGPRPDLWSDTTKQIIEQLNRGETQANIARSLGVSRQLVNQVVHKPWPKANYYKLTHMGPEELAVQIADWVNGECPPIEFCPRPRNDATNKVECIPWKCWLKWLKESSDG